MSESKKRTAFANRIAKYGLTPKDVHADVLQVGKKQLISLGALGRKPSFHPPRFLRAEDAQDVKRWIGTPDIVFKAKPKLADRYRLADRPENKKLLAAFDDLHRKHEKPEDPKARRSHALELHELINKNRNDVRVAAKAFLYGDSSLVKPWQGLLDFHFRDYLVPLWLYGTVIIESGGVLLLDEGNNILSGNALVIEEGGTLRSTRYLNLDFAEIRRTI